LTPKSRPGIAPFFNGVESNTQHTVVIKFY